MPKYQCNVCAKIYTLFNDAALCHPDVNIIRDEQDNTQQSMHWTIGDSPRSKPYPRPMFDSIAQADTTPPDSQ